MQNQNQPTRALTMHTFEATDEKRRERKLRVAFNDLVESWQIG